MTTIFFLCAIFSDGVSCLPFSTAENCAVARMGLADIATLSQCSPVEMRTASEYAPSASPLPVERKSS